MTVNRGGAKLDHWLTCEQQIDPANPGDWVMTEDNESYRRWECYIGDMIVQRTEHKGTAQLLKDNHEAMADSAGQRWGDGKVIGSMPPNLYFQLGLGEANKQRDLGYVRKIWNDSDYAKLRKFRGRI